MTDGIEDIKSTLEDAMMLMATAGMSRQVCPHCQTAFFLEGEPQGLALGQDRDGTWSVHRTLCPACIRIIISLQHVGPNGGTRLVWPRESGRPPAPATVPPQIAQDYKEACAILADSPTASAALSRRCLQSVLRDKAGIKPGDLANEIQQVLDSGKLPSHLADAIDGIRNIGNFAAHPIKSQVTGDILPVEPGEAEWNLDTLEGLFDFYYVQPAVLASKKAALNAKLKEAGKPEMK